MQREEDPSRADGQGKKSLKTQISKNVVVREREFKSDSTHQDIVTGIAYVNGSEFLTCSQDLSMKLWDKHLKGVAYTYETHKPLSSMNITGENDELLIVGQGQGDFIVFGRDDKNQLDIVEWAHATPIIDIVSLSKLKNKYFATRCIDGHVNVWSSLNHPDKIAALDNFDGDKEALAHLQPQPEEEVKVEKKKKKEPKYDSDGELIPDSEEGEEAQEEDPEPAEEEEEEAKKKKKKKAEPPVYPVLIGRPEPSDRDTMIEIKTNALIQSSSTMLAVSCFKEKQVIIVNVDIKTRSKTIKQTFQTEHSPTYLYQIDVDHMLVGTQAGSFEIWNIDASVEKPEMKQVIVAHEGSAEGISSIVELGKGAVDENGNSLLEPSPLITGEPEGSSDRFLVSSSRDRPEILIWRLSQKDGQIKMTIHIRISTTFDNGIKYVLQTSPTQLVCVNHEKTLKFYDFVDKAAQQEKKQLEEETQRFAVLVGEAFKEADADGNGWLDLYNAKFVRKLLKFA